MRTTTLQSNMTLGEVSPKLFARIDSELYNNGVSKAENVVINPHGGLRRRGGLTKAFNNPLPQGKMFTFEFSLKQDYLIYVIEGSTLVFKDKELVSTLVNDYTLSQIKDLDTTQSGDVMIFTHTESYPKFLRRLGSDTSWELVDVPLSNIPVFDYGTGDEPVWSIDRGYPATCTFFQSRLWFGGSTSRPSSVWGSKVNSYYDFDIGTGQLDYAIFDTIDTDQFNQIVNIFAGRNLMVFTGNAEFYNTAEIITSESSVWKRSTKYGSKRVSPQMIDGAIIYVDTLGRNVRSTVYEFTEDSYVSPAISLLSEHLITNVVAMDSIKGSVLDVSDFVYIVNEDGTIAVLNTIRSENIQGWTQWTTNYGYFKDVCVVNDVVYFLVMRRGEYYIEFLNEGTTVDHNVLYKADSSSDVNIIHYDSEINIVHEEVNLVFSSEDHSITQIDTKETANMASLPHKVLLDGSVEPDSLGGVIVFGIPSNEVEVGLDVTVKIHTLPLNTHTQAGLSRNKIKRVVKLHLNLYKTLGLSVFDIDIPDRKFKLILDEPTALYTGFKEVSLLGFKRDYILELSQDNPLPCTILGIGYIVATN